MDGACEKHVFERMEASCTHCGGEYCGDCVVYPYGQRKPLCVSCAIAAAGIRSSAARPVMRSRREIRRAEKERKRAAKAAPTTAAPAELFEAQLSSVPRGIEFEFGNDDMATNRPGVESNEPEVSDGSRSLFDQVEPVDQAS